MGADVTEEVVAAGDESGAHLTTATHVAGETDASLGETRGVFRGDSGCSFAGVGLPGTCGAGWLVPESSSEVAEIKHPVGEGHRGRHGGGHGMTEGARRRGLLSLLAEALGTEHGAGERAAPRGLVSPVVQLHSLQRSAEGERVGRAATETARELEQLLRGATREQVTASGRRRHGRRAVPVGVPAKARREDGVERGRQQRVIIGFIVRVEAASSAESDVALYLSLGSLHVLRRTSDLEARFAVSGRRNDVGVGDLLDSLHGGPLGPNDEPDDPVRDPHEDGDFVIFCRRAEGAGRRRNGAAAARGADLRKVIGGCQNFPLG